MVSWAPHVICRRVGAELVLLDTEQGEYYGLDAVGARIVSVLEQSASATQAWARLSELYDVPGARLREDGERLLAELTTRGLIVAHESSAVDCPEVGP